jgi:hypothetical protein
MEEEERIGPTPERLAKVETGTIDLIESEGKGGTTKRAGLKIISPLEELMFNSRITEREYQAGMRFYTDYVYTERPSQAVMKWKEYISSSHSPDDLDHAERVAFHSKRYADAKRVLGTYMGAVARMLLIEEMSCIQIGRAVHGYKNANSASASGVSLATAMLDMLARFYRL